MLDAVLDSAGVDVPKQRLVVLRAVDKFDRLGLEGVAELLGEGRKDESGDFTPGAKLPRASTARSFRFCPAMKGPEDAAVSTIIDLVREAAFVT